MKRMVHYNKNGFVDRTTVVYEKDEGPTLLQQFAVVLYGAVALGTIWYFYNFFNVLMK